MARTILIDRGWNRIKRDTKALQGQAVKVGFRAGPASNGVQVVDYATFSEFGTEHIPSRPFMRRTADQAEKPIRPFASNLVAGLINGNLNVAGVMTALGTWYKDRIQTTIRTARSWATPNAPSTIKAKGSSQPLIDDGVMVANIDYERTRL